MTIQTIALGTTANDGTGDTLRAAGTKINANFAELTRNPVIENAPTFTGSELIADSNFATDPASSGWTLNDSTWSAGEIDTTYDGSNNPAITVPVLGLVSGHTYLISIDLVMTGDLNRVTFSNATGQFTSAGPDQDIIFVSNYTGDDVLHLSFYNFNVDATRVLTHVSMREIAAPVAALTVVDPLGITVLSLGDGVSTNLFMGRYALFSNVSGVNNVAIGPYALQSSVNDGNVAVGYQALQQHQGAFATAVGQKALFKNTTGAQNVAFGSNALRDNVDATGSTAVGFEALKVANAPHNTAVGAQSLQQTSSGTDNTALGFGAIQDNATGSFNTAVGSQSYWVSTSGSNNVAVGYNVGQTMNGAGSGNTMIGYQADGAAADQNNSIAIGSGSIVPASNTAQIGNASVRSLNVGAAGAVSTLPSAATVGAGARSFVTDALTTLVLGLGTTVANGGANKVPVYSDGTNWIYG